MKLDSIGNTKVCKELVELLQPSEHNTEFVTNLIAKTKEHLDNIADVDKPTRDYLVAFIVDDVHRELISFVEQDGNHVSIWDKSMEVVKEYMRFKFDHDSTPMDEEFMHPIQPLGFDAHGVLRFKKNPIVRDMLDLGKYNLNDLAMRNFCKEDGEQFAQLIGFSLSGFGDFPYATDRVYDKATDDFDEANPITTHPNQPIIDGKYKENKIVCFLYGNSQSGVNVDSEKYSDDDRRQLYQLIGCTVGSELFKQK